MSIIKHLPSWFCVLLVSNEVTTETSEAKSPFGTVASEATTADKFKEMDGVIYHLLRFIFILTLMISYMRKCAGDSWSLLQAPL